MSDGEDLDAQLNALEEAAPLTPEPEEDNTQPATNAAAPAEGEPPPAAPKEPQAPLSPEELAKRYENTKAALREERQRRRELAAQQEQMEKALTEIRARVNQPQAQPQQQQQPQTREEWRARMLQEGWSRDEILWAEKEHDDRVARQQMQAEERQRDQQQRQSREIETLQSRMSDSEREFREEQPDYDDAITHLRTTWDTQFEAMGYTPEQRMQLINQLSLSAVQTAITQKRDPAQAIYEAAKRAGYRSNGTVVPQSGGTPQQPQGKIDQLRAGQEAAKTLSGGGSGVQGEGMSLKSIASLKGAAFDAALEKFLSNAR